MAEREEPTFAVGVRTTTARLAVGVGRGRPIHRPTDYLPTLNETVGPRTLRLANTSKPYSRSHGRGTRREDQRSRPQNAQQEAVATLEKALQDANAACAEAGRKADRERDAAFNKLADLAGREHTLQEYLQYARVDFDQVLREKQQLHTQLQKARSCIIQMLGELSTALAENAQLKRELFITCNGPHLPAAPTTPTD
ncbi:PREDICTED: uncharacterized protein LOC106811083 [Priapulus caudatus]|uniref:Uncharacterized protein LOC106811083 n=1 Tax=Priapulus caudatus TaxID=37621 RepID=A0ABM1ED29_PRICU|nr:PREDICTED: uncharacterized protein LOC106811083 [Priapulus caudatus]